MPMPPEANPRLVFERIFGEGEPGERAANLDRRRGEEKSILDFALEGCPRSAAGHLSARDAEKLEQYLTGVRELEARIKRAEKFGPPKDPAAPTPAGIPRSYTEHLRLDV